jgi:hypothetical protein
MSQRGWTSPLTADRILQGLRAAVRWQDVGRAVAIGVLLAFTGVLTGLLWTWLGPHGHAEMTDIGAVRELPYGEAAFAGEATFGAIGLVAGLLTGLAAFLLRRHRGPIVLLGVAIGSLAAAWVASRVGASVGHDEFERLLRGAADGQHFTMPVALTAKGLLLVQPLVATAAYTLIAAWSPDPQLRTGIPVDPSAPPDAPGPPSDASEPPPEASEPLGVTGPNP